MAEPIIARLLVIRFGAMGDLLHVAPSLAAVGRVSPQTEIHVLTAPLYEPLMQALPDVARVWTWDKATGWPGLWRLAGPLRVQGFEAVVNLHPSLRTWLFSHWVGAARQATYRKEKLARRGAAQRSLTRLHAVDDFARPFRHLFAAMGDLRPPTLPVHPLSPDLSRSGRWIGLIPGVGHHRANRAWPQPTWQELMHGLTGLDPDLNLVLLGGPDEAGLAGQLRDALPPALRARVTVACGPQSILETAAMMAACELVVGGDTGPLHLAAAAGVPVIGLYGPTSAQRTGPRGVNALNTELTPPTELACWPCEAPFCPLRGAEELACMREMTPASVLAACRRVLAGEQQKALGW
ncbi:MAG: glycosyltransferase family 9 protein [Candidatus Melainabacteria bacterium]